MIGCVWNPENPHHILKMSPNLPGEENVFTFKILYKSPTFTVRSSNHVSNRVVLYSDNEGVALLLVTVGTPGVTAGTTHLF